MPSRLFSLRILASIALLLAAVLKVGAEPIRWSYEGQVIATGKEASGPHAMLAFESSGPVNQVQFADVAGSETGSAAVTAYKVRVSTDFLADFFAPLDNFKVALQILDKASGKVGVTSFTGTLDGRMYGLSGSGIVDVTLFNTGPTQQRLILGDHVYLVSIDPHPFPISAKSALGWNGPIPFVTPYQDVQVSVQAWDLPEPSTLALAALGLSGLGLRAWRRRKLSRARIG